ASTSAKHFEHQDYINFTKQTQKEGGIPMSTSLLDKLIAEREASQTKLEELIAEHETSQTKLDELIAERETNEAKGEAKTIIRILSRRLKMPSKSLQKKICSIKNIAKLDELVDFALTCVSLDEFATALK
ncbi:MAG: hypothetical protein LBC02_08210, partial [Planctomycetaceae bacterium]|nr:hypothetical protein [Planctomycetaceae bacterium]